jgi:class 3 adenylate cyclase
VVCSNCGSENRAGAKFCAKCGSTLALGCPSCGSPFALGDAFCVECGTRLDGSAGAVELPEGAPAAVPTAERRLVSVLFADLVGFTALSESRDAEEVRELLSRYFDACRRIVAIYGGTVEKFIGDAVMAVWGTPTATEDDAERAVRAALDLLAAVSALGQAVGAEELRARAGVLTGEAAVTLGAEGEGMVAGDLVNTASRIQSAANPGTVLVGETTRRATDETISYEEAGSFELKGKAGLTPLWRAQRVLSGRGGSLRSQALEAPFVGRDRELRQIKELFHDSADEGKAHLVSVTGIAGIGKSRLAWEFYKYFDGIADNVYWHRGRCLPYGEGVTYWALADMVRMRCRIAEDDDAAVGYEKLQSTLEEHVLDQEDRAFVEPRLAHLLGFAELEGAQKQDLFAAWRLFFERLAEVYPAILAFEDMQWADESLLDFVEYLLDWSRGHRLFVVTLARPELTERRPTWGAGQRSFTSMYLEPLSRQAMEELLNGLVPGLPDDLRDRILERAEGVPLYAVETVRMLLDRGLLAREGQAYRLAGEVEALEVPETLHALLAARLDGLSAEERRLLQDAAVLGKTFTTGALAALSNLAEEELEPLLTSLARKEVLGLQVDPRSPERGQYGFLQDLVRHVAYETLARRDRRDRHLAAAAYLASAFPDEDDVVEVVASHYVAAYDAQPDAEDAAEVKEKAREALVRAAERAATLAAASEAQRYFEQAARLAADEPQRAELLVRAGEMAGRGGQPDEARRLLEEAIAGYEAEGDTHAAARATAALGGIIAFVDREEALARLEAAFDVISGDDPDETLAQTAALLSRMYWFTGDFERAAERAELALDVAETNRYIGPLIAALHARAAAVAVRGHNEEWLALAGHALALALEHDRYDSASRFNFILADHWTRLDRYSDALPYLDEGLMLARKIGSRPMEWSSLAERTFPLLMLGRWDEVAELLDGVTQEQVDSGGVLLSALQAGVEVNVHRGDLDAARRIHSMFARLDSSVDLQDRSSWLGATAVIQRAEGKFEAALASGRGSIEAGQGMGAAFQGVKQAFVEALEAALALGATATAEAEEIFALVEGLRSFQRPPYLEAQVQRLRARGAGDTDGLRAAVARFRELETPFWLAVALLEYAELSGDESSLKEAGQIFSRLRATPWLERAGGAVPEREAGIAG